MPLALNRLYNRRYYVQRRLDRESSGAFSEVYLAEDRVDHLSVVIKESRPLNNAARQRFERERRIEERLGGDHIVRIRGSDDLGGARCLILEYMRGGSLGEDSTRSNLGPDHVPPIVGDVLRGLAAAHAAGVIHRDVKPGNVLLDGVGHAKLGDFGSAFDPSEPPLTRPSELVGTDDWMSPQQAGGEQPDPRDDLYSTGLLLYSLLSGDQPRMSWPGWRPRLDRIDDRFAVIVRKATADRREDRYPSAPAMLAELEHPRARQALAAQGAAHYLTLEDLRLLTDAARVRTLFRKLRYPVATDDDFTALDPAALELRGRAAELVREGWILSDLGESLFVVLIHLQDMHGAAIGTVASQFLARPADFLLVCTDSFERFVFVNPRRGSLGSRPRLHKLIVDRSRPTRHAVNVLEGLACGTADPVEVYRQQCEAFDVERVTKVFYSKYAQLLSRAKERIREWNPGLGMSFDEHRLDTFTQRLFSRILFLYFLQKKNWLAGQQGFLTNWYHRSQREVRSFFHEVLEPLFFEVLSAERPNSDSPFGAIPYLNGGLFERDYGTEFVHIPNELFDSDSEEGILGFLDDYDFTIEEDTPREVEVALDPEMLGKVFENLLEERERDSTGTFYTPRAIVHYMCRESLLLYLRDETELAESLLRELFEEQESYGIGARDATRVDEALGRLRVLDPAVGSGAFLVGTLQVMVQVRRACKLARQADVARTGAEVAGWKRDFIQRSLYGVDIKPEAVEIARLRLWLSLVVDLDMRVRDVEPLPNLDYRIVPGNSLLESFDATNGRGMELVASEVRSMRHAIAERRSEYFKETDQARKLAERGAIAADERRLADRWLTDRLTELRLQFRGLLDGLGAARGRAAGGDPKIKQLDERITHYENLRRQVAGPDRPFSYRLNFSEVFEGENPGFDVVIANPPYTNVQRVNALEYTEELKKAYGWLDDLYVHFVFRGFELVRDGGIIAFITSDTFLTIGTKQRLRDLLLQNQLLALARCDPFEATVDNAVILARKGAAEPGGTIFFANGNGKKAELFDDLGPAETATVSREVLVDGETYAVLAGPTEPLPRYRSPLALYRRTLKHAFFEPSPLNLALYETFMPRLMELYGAWWPRIRNSAATTQNAKALSEYRTGLQAGELSLLGLLTEGGQGLATADNPRFLAHLQGTPQGEADEQRLIGFQTRWRTRQPAIWRRYQELLQDMPRYEAVDALRLAMGGQALGIGRMALYRTISEQQTADPANMSEDEKRHGIDGERCWVPFRKGDQAGNRWLSDEPLFIRWDRNTVRYFQENSGRRGANMPVIRNPHMYFRRLVSFGRVGRDTVIRARSIAGAVFDSGTPAIGPSTALVPAEYLLALLNAPLATHFCKAFLNNTKFELNDLRLLPIVVPTEDQRQRIVRLVTRVLEIQRQVLAGQADRADLQPVERAINDEIFALYGIDPALAPPDGGSATAAEGGSAEGEGPEDDERLDE